MGETTWAYYERLHRESCLREGQLKQQLESMTNERNELKSIKELCLWSNQILEINKLNEQLKEAVEVIVRCEFALQPEFYGGKDSGALKDCSQFLAKYRGEKLN